MPCKTMNRDWFQQAFDLQLADFKAPRPKKEHQLPHRVPPSPPQRPLQHNGDVPSKLPSPPHDVISNTDISQGFALAAALAQMSAPTNQRVINLLGLHVLLKTFVYYPCYLFDVAPLRSLAHFGATASVINVAWQLATGAK